MERSRFTRTVLLLICNRMHYGGPDSSPRCPYRGPDSSAHDWACRLSTASSGETQEYAAPRPQNGGTYQQMNLVVVTSVLRLPGDPAFAGKAGPKVPGLGVADRSAGPVDGGQALRRGAARA